MKLELDKINANPKTLEEAIKVIDQLINIVIELKKENDSLREQRNNNSGNSSLPPSRDIKKRKIQRQKMTVNVVASRVIKRGNEILFLPNRYM